jgi:hypothetical protein
MESATAALGTMQPRNQAGARSPQPMARFAGLLYLVITVAAIVAHFYVPAQLLVPSYSATPALVALLIGIAEIAFPLWLLIRGVNGEQWSKRTLPAA